MRAASRTAGAFRRWTARLFVATLLAPLQALAQHADPVRWQLNLHPGVTETSQRAYDLHMFVLWICVGIALLVFGAMAVAMVRFRKSKGAVAAQFSHNTTAEIIWTVVPVILLVVMAWPATAQLIAQYDTRNAGMTVKITGAQWLWKYEYLGQDVRITSRLARGSDRLRQSGQRPAMTDVNYLLDVDNELVLPVDTKIRFVITSDDVIHAWWVPALGWKQDAIPGLINEAWTDIAQPGIYRGQCTELCGKDHGFMPVVVRAVPKAEFARWLANERATQVPLSEPVGPAETGTGTGPRQQDAEEAQQFAPPATTPGILPAPDATPESGDAIPPTPAPAPTSAPEPAPATPPAGTR